MRGGPGWLSLTWGLVCHVLDSFDTTQLLPRPRSSAVGTPAYADLLSEGPSGPRRRPHTRTQTHSCTRVRASTPRLGVEKASSQWALFPSRSPEPGPWPSWPPCSPLRGTPRPLLLSLECSRVMSSARCLRPAAHSPSPPAPLRPDSSSLSNPLETPARPSPQLRLSRSSITVVLRERHLESRQAVPSFPFSPSQRSGLLSLPSSVCRCHSVCPCAVCMLYGRMRVGVGRGPGLHLRLTPLTPTLVTPRPSRLWSGHSTPGSLRGAGEHPSSLAQDLRTEVAESPVPGCVNVL